MTELIVGDLRPRVAYVADGAAQAFAFPFPVMAADHLLVRIDEQPAELPYAVTGLGESLGGTVTFDAAPPNGAQILLLRATPIERSSDFAQAGELRAAALNAELDRLTLMLQEVSATLGDCLRLSPSGAPVDLQLSAAAPRANSLLGFDAQGRPTPVTPATAEGLADLIQVSQEVAAEADAAEQAATAAGLSATAAQQSADAAEGWADAAQAAADATAAIAVEGRVPVGSLLDYAGAAAPAGWLLCNGQNVSRATYAELFAVLGETFGAGDGSTTFGLPDLRGRVSAGADAMGGVAAGRLTQARPQGVGGALGEAGGAETHTLTAAELAAHAHAFETPVPSVSTFSPVTNRAGGNPAGYLGGTQPAGFDHPHNNVQPTLVLTKIIYAGA